MTVAQTILDQLGGNRFVVMTGASHFVADGYTLRMQLPKNHSKANRLWITLDADDTYTMHFFKYTAPRLNTKTWTYSDEKKETVKKVSGIYFDQLQEIFTETTWMYTRITPRRPRGATP